MEQELLYRVYRETNALCGTMESMIRRIDEAISKLSSISEVLSGVSFDGGTGCGGPDGQMEELMQLRALLAEQMARCLETVGKVNSLMHEKPGTAGSGSRLCSTPDAMRELADCLALAAGGISPLQDGIRSQMGLASRETVFRDDQLGVLYSKTVRWSALLSDAGREVRKRWETYEQMEARVEAPRACRPLRPNTQAKAPRASRPLQPDARAEALQASKPLRPDTVQFSAIASKRADRGAYTLIDVVMYEPAWRHVVDELLQTAEEPVQEKRSGIMTAVEGASVRVRLESPDVAVEDNEDTQTWTKGYLQFSFACKIPDTYEKKQILFTAWIYMDDVIMTRLKFVVQCGDTMKQAPTVRRHDVHSVFVSYASQDRAHVAAVVQGMRKIRPDLDIFFDVESLRSGDDWEQKLYSAISARDLLYLCWSHFARESRWVEAEWRYALKTKGPDAIEPIPLEMPDECPPPEELRQKHFSDRLLYIIRYASSGEIPKQSP